MGVVTCGHCGGKAVARGMCSAEYQRWRKRRVANEDGAATCSDGPCQKVAVVKGRCMGHYQKWRKKRKPGKDGVRGCGEGDCKRAMYAKGRCVRHYVAHRKRARRSTRAGRGALQEMAGWGPLEPRKDDQRAVSEAQEATALNEQT